MDIGAAIQAYGYPVVLAGSLLEGESVVALGGLAARRGYLELPWVVACAAAGGFLGDQFFFALGRCYGARLLQRFPRLAPSMARVHVLVDRYDHWIVIGLRFMYGLRIAGLLAIGMSRIGWLRFAGLNLVGALLWAPFFVAAGYMLGAALELLMDDLERIEHWMFIGLVMVGIALWLAWRRRRP
jgi:membrane protein DedA with SNARE-associated domain